MRLSAMNNCISCQRSSQCYLPPKFLAAISCDIKLLVTQKNLRLLKIFLYIIGGHVLLVILCFLK